MTEKDIVICGHGSGTPSLKNLDWYLSYRYAQKMSNGKRKGLLRVRRLKGMTSVKEQTFHDTYATILGRNSYNQDLRQYVYTPRNGRYYSDCSSSGCATYQRMGFEIPLMNTAAMLGSDLFTDVPVRIVGGHITNPEVLRVGDALLFAGNINRPSLSYVGHVEYIYELPIDTYTGWKQSGNIWEYIEHDEPVRDAWRYIGGRWYVFDGSGRMITGWFHDSGNDWYYMAEDGGMCSSQWVTTDTAQYYVCADGRMARNCYVRDRRQISPGRYIYYWVDEDGRWDPAWDTESPNLEKYALADAQKT